MFVLKFLPFLQRDHGGDQRTRTATFPGEMRTENRIHHLCQVSDAAIDFVLKARPRIPTTFALTLVNPQIEHQNEDCRQIWVEGGTQVFIV